MELFFPILSPPHLRERIYQLSVALMQVARIDNSLINFQWICSSGGGNGNPFPEPSIFPLVGAASPFYWSVRGYDYQLPLNVRAGKRDCNRFSLESVGNLRQLFLCFLPLAQDKYAVARKKVSSFFDQPGG